jgi:hypothetical protein
MKGDSECEEHDCEGLEYCTWHPNECYGKPWARKSTSFQRIISLQTFFF